MTVTFIQIKTTTYSRVFALRPVDIYPPILKTVVVAIVLESFFKRFKINIYSHLVVRCTDVDVKR